ncbi:iron ABC transporter permease [bacterium]|nr:iron ABC transporter permease [bacterium]
MPTDFRVAADAAEGTPARARGEARPGGTGAGADAGAGATGREPLDPRAARCVWLGVAMLLLVLTAIVLPSGWFSMNMRATTLAQWALMLRQRVAGLVSFVTLQGATYSMDAVTWRYVVVALAGAALATAGAVFQGATRNGLASPSTLGVITGCSLGRIVFVLCFANTSGIVLSGITASQARESLEGLGGVAYVTSVYGMALCSLAGGLLVVVAVLGIATAAGRGRPSGVTMVIAGQVIAGTISAVLGLVQYVFTLTGDGRAELLRTLSVQTFTYTFRGLDALLVSLPILACLALLMTRRGALDALAFGDEQASSMGVSARATRRVAVGACTVMTGVVVAFCGQIGMVGFMIPHLARRVVGPSQRYLMPASALMGAGLLTLAYFVTTLFESGATDSLGAFVSAVGGVAFLVMVIVQRRRGHGADWI